MDTWLTQGILKGRGKYDQQMHEEVFKFLGYGRDENQNNTYISSHPS
jgi:hypothetical protein